MSEWTGPSLTEVLEAAELLRGVQVGRPHVHERVFARDRAGNLGVVATIRPVGRAGRAWYWSYYLLSWDGAAWHAEDGQGDRWARDPETPRSQTPGYDVGTSISGGGSDDGMRHIVTGGAVGHPVATLEVVTTVERHFVPIDQASGAFTMLALHAGDGDMRFELTARAADGRELDRWVWNGDVQPEWPDDVELIETHDALGTSIAAIRREVRE